ncbi:SGNH/GDSL hydrolase family protein [Roseofilum sp. BLCC_M154]|uniref:SGNH/GDSL hydrolase family protein n=1 Tax=Roseofilum acuticapitatum BLCC-M154 TaxID=3022444 RepID=A0ABT7ALU4_9CYAN|nr:SGNH/GDSL hydrolase family protein [Roseofilum acuticapitatum]MDJ1167874.1 SGNH/GDSL hydrolase family protein [Roseofilum acuticapitatum BLCC-M154]
MNFSHLFKKGSPYRIPLGILAFFLIVEVFLRLGLGLGKPALVQADRDTGYRFQPNQHLWRFGKTIIYNQYSQRSNPITPETPQGTLRVLMVGDSVLNGGNPTDQADIISEQFKLKLETSGYPLEVLNASSGSWGLGNQWGYLQKFGLFDSDLVILQIGVHDLLQPTSTSDSVGSIYFPDRPPVLAISEAWSRYAWPRIQGYLPLNTPSSEIPKPQLQPQAQFAANMNTFQQMVQFIRAQNIPVMVLFTPNHFDLIPTPQTPPYYPEFLALLESENIPVIDVYQAWSSLSPSVIDSFFRDSVHLNEQGNQAVATLICQHLQLGDRLPSCVK